MKKILITGSSGMLGSALAKMYVDRFEIFCTSRCKSISSNFKFKEFDLSSSYFDVLLEWSQPDVIIHCAALTDVNYCANNEEEAYLVNGYSMEKILSASNMNTQIIYISSDAVFGSKIHLAKEDDTASPDSIYGKSKKMAEMCLINSDRKYKIIRTTIVGFNENRLNTSFAEWIINSAINGQQIGLFNDVIFNPITIWDLGVEIEFLINDCSISSEIIHVSGSEVCTKYNFGELLVEELNLSKEFIRKDLLSERTDLSVRAFDQSLSCTYYQNKYKRNLPNLKQTIFSLKNHYNKRRL